MSIGSVIRSMREGRRMTQEAVLEAAMRGGNHMLRGKDIIAIPPGETIREQLESRGMSQKEFSKRMDMSEKHISHLINGKVELTHDVALRLETVLGLPAKYWNNLEAQYREKEARVKTELEAEREEEIAPVGYTEQTRIP